MRNSRKRLPWLQLGLSLAVATLFPTASKAQGSMRKLAFYEVHQATAAPNADGMLPDAAWKEANSAGTYYEYWKSSPGLGELKTEFRMLYDERGIYLKLTNYETQLDKIRGTLTNHDDPRLWTDDSAQIYFDPQASGVGFVNFTVNCLGTMGDMKRLDAAVVLNDWSGSQWHAKTRKTADAWIIEGFFPWADLGKKANQGDIWMFDHVRFSWTTGKYVGVTWAPGGNYASPTKFGYLHFAGKTEAAPLATGKLLSRIASPPWVLPLNSGLLMCSATGEVSSSSAADTIGAYRAELAKAASRAAVSAERNPDAKRQLSEVQARVADLKYQTTAEALEAVLQIAQATTEVNEIYWRTSARNLVDTVTTRGKVPAIQTAELPKGVPK